MSLKEQYPYEYIFWANAIQGCRNVRSRAWLYYGARGVRFHEDWRFFRVFILDVGARESNDHVLERFPDKNGDFKPGNVQWITKAEQRFREDRELFASCVLRAPNGCLEWQRFRNDDGYGWVRRRGIRDSYIYAHRYAWFLHYHTWPTRQINHTCDNPACCDVSHLYEGTQQENIQDMIRRGRHAWQRDGRMRRA